MKYYQITAPASKFGYTHNRIISLRPRTDKNMNIDKRYKNVSEHIQLARINKAEVKRARKSGQTIPHFEL